MKIKCPQCGAEFELSDWSKDDLGYCVWCNECDSSFDIDEETIARAVTEGLQVDGITSQEISKELDYRDISGGNKWNDSLYQYTDEELSCIEKWLNKLQSVR